MQDIHHEQCCFLGLMHYEYSNTINTLQISLHPPSSIPTDVIRICVVWDRLSTTSVKGWKRWVEATVQNAGAPLCVFLAV